MTTHIKKMLLLAAMTLIVSCATQGGKTSASVSASASASADNSVKQVKFNADSAFGHVEKQCAFGPRVPGTDAHKACARYLEDYLRAHCDEVVVQRPTLTTFDNTRLEAVNLVGVINPQAERRILLVAHWDCRPWADSDPDPAKVNEPVMGANDGASGTAVLLELARVLHAQKPEVGVDLLLTDVEDWGAEDNEDSWALGTQYWVENKHKESYKPLFGILLDMVGAKGATFHREAFSDMYASNVVDEVWRVAAEQGFSQFFIDSMGGGATDDHVCINKGGIPCIDIVDMRTSTTGFYPGWHTTHDTVDQIDRATLHAVGQTIAALIYEY